MRNQLGEIFSGKKVLVTGAFGFKGSWLCSFLKQLNADVAGYSLYPKTALNHFNLLNLGIKSIQADINDAAALKEYIDYFKPDIVFHLAAQSLVRYSYQNPLETYQTNVIGTANVLEACRFQDSVKAIVAVTSDKCYENNETGAPFKESDPMGGYDPYSSSKGCAELVVAAYRNSYFNVSKYNVTHHCLLASARAGNVIGGGDWSDDRLIPDMVKTAADKKPVIIRSPDAVRPWQHVMEPLFGYLLLGKKLLEGQQVFADAWNFGPRKNEVMTVKEVLDIASEAWRDIKYSIETDETLHEAKLLTLDCSKANQVLDWHPVWDCKTAIINAVNWYKKYYTTGVIETEQNVGAYLNLKRQSK